MRKMTKLLSETVFPATKRMSGVIETFLKMHLGDIKMGVKNSQNSTNSFFVNHVSANETTIFLSG